MQAPESFLTAGSIIKQPGQADIFTGSLAENQELPYKPFQFYRSFYPYSFMPIHDTNDAELRTLIYEHPKVIVKFTKEQCLVCERMARIYNQLSVSPEYQDITFLRMDAAENPVSSKEVKMTGTPFFATYVNGLLNQCSLLSKKETLVEMLNDLKVAAVS